MFSTVIGFSACAAVCSIFCCVSAFDGICFCTGFVCSAFPDAAFCVPALDVPTVFLVPPDVFGSALPLSPPETFVRVPVFFGAMASAFASSFVIRDARCNAGIILLLSTAGGYSVNSEIVPLKETFEPSA